MFEKEIQCSVNLFLTPEIASATLTLESWGQWTTKWLIYLLKNYGFNFTFPSPLQKNLQCNPFSVPMSYLEALLRDQILNLLTEIIHCNYALC